MALPSSSAYGSLRSTCFPVGFFESPTFYSWILGRLGAQKVWMSTCSWASCLGLRKNYSYTNCRANDLACMRQLVQTCPWSKHTTALGKCMNTPTCPWCVHWGFLTCFIRQFDGYPHHVVTNVQNQCFRSPWHLALGAAPISAPFSVPFLPTRRPQPGVLSFGNMNAQYLEKTRNVAQIATADP